LLSEADLKYPTKHITPFNFEFVVSAIG